MSNTTATNKTPPAAPAKPAMLPLLNTGARLLTIARYRRPRPDASPVLGLDGKPVTAPMACDRVQLAPGYTFVPSDAVTADDLRALAGQVVVRGPEELPIEQAIDVAQRTRDRRAARHWRSIETRPEVIAALDRRIAGVPADSDA